MKKLFLTLLLALPSADAAALELLLEENRGESGTIGYVDIDRVFKEYSGTTGAREDFIGEIRKRESALNVRKTEIFTLKAEIAKLRQEREFALTLPSLLETQRSVAEAAAQAQAAAQALALSASSAAAAGAEASTAAVAASTQAVTASTAAAGAPAVLPAQQPAAAPPPALPSGLPGLEGIDMPGIAKVPVNHFKFSVSTAVPEIDAAIARKSAELSSKEEELRQAQLRSEKELLDYEGRKSEMLLGRIYVALKELAIKEEVSVVVDKRNILYGQSAVDLTSKLIKRLEEDSI